ncbi:DUF5709 domain-containing protein [Allosalinactinospora lopnorensis]|uniref:DUF5709 domain-containing protein n=1 Tax=Allosalinactinospora lopnorensis TaxID=1352348 RepID=UPI000623CA00|nr:DUF5709 domain-containing protein [Allosalinactinospora lopnorensis]
MDEKYTENSEDPINDEAVDWEEAGLPAQEDSTEDQPLPSDRPSAMGEHGSGGTEKEAGESLDTALSRNRPDTPEATGSAAPTGTGRHGPPADEQVAGTRLVEEDEGIREDEEKALTAEDVGEDRGAYSPEEQAVRTEEEGPGTV